MKTPKILVLAQNTCIKVLPFFSMWKQAFFKHNGNPHAVQCSQLSGKGTLSCCIFRVCTQTHMGYNPRNWALHESVASWISN